MSNITVLCPNGHRVKVSTNPNMSLQAILETAAKKKGFDPSLHVLEFHKKRLDLSNTVRFSGLPNNATIEMEQLSEEELEKQGQQEVCVCLQLPDGERLTGNFPVSASLGHVLDKWQEKTCGGAEGEQPVVVYMRREVIGREELESVTLRTLGLLQGKGLFRFFYKKPEDLKIQANVYEMKVQEKAAPAEIRHVPMRLDPDNKKDELPIADEVIRDTKNDAMEVDDEPCDNSKTETPNASNPNETISEVRPASKTGEEKKDSIEPMEMPDSTQPEPIIKFVGPNDAIIFSSTDSNVKYQDIDDDFFELSLDEVKTMYKDLKNEVKRLTEGDMMMTKEMRENQREGEKLAMLSKYKSCVLRIQFPCRHVVQGIFSPNTSINDVIDWLAPLLHSSQIPHELYTAPPRTSLAVEKTLMELHLFPAALVHFANLVTKAGPVQYLSDDCLANLSNITGANSVASQARRRVGAGGNVSLGIQEGQMNERELFEIPESTSSSRNLASDNYTNSSNVVGSGGKVPKWFKPSKK